MKKYVLSYALLLLLGIASGSVATYYLFPRTIMLEQTQTTITWAIGHGYHYSVPVIMQHFEMMQNYSDGSVNLDVVVLKGPAVSEALLSGSAHFAQRSAPAIITDIDNEAPFKMLLSVGKKDHELWTTDLDIHSLSDLTSENTINLVNPNSVEEIGLKLGLQKIGKTLDDVSVTYLKHTDAYQSMISGTIDCDYTGSPYTVRYASEPDKYHMLATDTDLYNMTLPASMVYAKTDYVEENPNIVSYAVSAWCEAISWINANPEQAADITATFYGDPTDTAYQEWQDSNIVFNPTIGLSALPALSDILHDAEVINKAFTAEELLFPVALGLGGY